jgi:DNA-binding beta-propeller fold protein YncE
VADDLNNRIQVFTEGVIVLDDAVPDDNDGVQQVFTLAGIGPGSYTFTELPVPGWQLIGISCEGADYQADLASRTLTIDLAEAQTADCIFENALTGTITIHKETSPADGTDFSFNSNALPVFTYLKQWGGSGSGNGKFNSPAGVDVDAGGNVYVADEFNHRIQVFDAGGKYLRQWGKQGAGNSEFSFPTDVEVAAGGISYVVDSGNNRVQKFDANGNYLAK